KASVPQSQSGSWPYPPGQKSGDSQADSNHFPAPKHILCQHGDRQCKRVVKPRQQGIKLIADKGQEFKR
ncbi:hypothetical protein ACNSPB_03515, partial [Yersinia enterocolitica]